MADNPNDVNMDAAAAAAPYPIPVVGARRVYYRARRRLGGRRFIGPQQPNAVRYRPYLERRRIYSRYARNAYRRSLYSGRQSGRFGARSLIGTGLQKFGGMWGKKTGNFLGKVGDVFSKVIGLGAYSVQSNTLVDEMITGKQVPVMQSTDDSVVIRHREYICDVNSSINFNNMKFEVNPGLATTFPWLSTIAQNFEQYKWRGLIFQFKSTSANALNSVNTALGSVTMASEYNVNAPSFINKQQVLNNMWTTNAKPSESFIHPIECAPSLNPQTMFYVRTVPGVSAVIPPVQDLRLYDLCNLQVVTDGSQAAANVGELWASYEIELLKPQVGYGGIAGSAQSCHYQLVSASAAAPFGTSRINKGDFIGLNFESNFIFNMPVGCAGQYLMVITYLGDYTVCGVPAYNVVNGSLVNRWYAGTSNLGGLNTNGTTFTVCCIFTITDTYKQFKLGLSAGTFPDNIQYADLYLTQLNGNLL